MNTTQLKCFSDPELLQTIQRRLLTEFLRQFQNSLDAGLLRLLSPDLPEADFFSLFGALMRSPQSMPGPMLPALLAIEAMAAPDNDARLQSDCLHAPLSLGIDAAWPPIQQALVLWLHRPYDLPSLTQTGPSDSNSVSDPAVFAPTTAPQTAPFPPVVPPAPASPNGDGHAAATVSDPPTDRLTPHPAPNGEPTRSQTPAPASVSASAAALQLPPGDLAAIARYPRYKISHLPPEVRESINHMLRLRIPYARMLEKLGEYGKGLNKSNLSRWKKTGYLIWLAEQERREDAQAQLHLLFDLLRENDNGKIHEATQQIAALRISQVLASFDPAALVQAFQQDPRSFVRLVQTLPTLSRGGMDCERLLVDLAERKQKLEEAKSPPQSRIPSREAMMEMARQIRLL